MPSSLKEYHLVHDVVTCEEAASAKGVPLRNELKTLLLNTSSGFLAVNIPGDEQLSLRSVKRNLGFQQARLATPDELKKIGLAPGIVCPFKKPVCGMPQYVSTDVMALDFITTNNGTLHGYYITSPTSLLRIPLMSVVTIANTQLA